MFLPLLLALQSAAGMPTMTEVKMQECVQLATSDPVSGIVDAKEWIGKQGGWQARQCLAFAQFKAGDAHAALASYERAASEAATVKATEVGKLWVQAGNAALVAKDAPRALANFGKAIASGQFEGEALGEIHLDRARAFAGAGDMAGARADIDKAHSLVPQDPLGWLLSATLARRQGDLARATADIGTAAKLAPGDPAVALEAGNIAISAGHKAGARKNWQATVDLSKGGPEGVAAAAHLAQLDAMERAPAAVAPKVK